MTHPNDELTAADRAWIEKLRPDKRARALLDHKRAARARQERRALTEQVVASGGVRYLEAQALAAQVATWSMSPTVLATAYYNPDFAKRVANLRDRAGRAVLAAAAPRTTPPSAAAPARGGEHLDPAEFARRVQVRRRMDALKKRKASR